jgi:hypothetical protein
MRKAQTYKAKRQQSPATTTKTPIVARLRKAIEAEAIIESEMNKEDEEAEQQNSPAPGQLTIGK